MKGFRQGRSSYLAFIFMNAQGRLRTLTARFAPATGIGQPKAQVEAEPVGPVLWEGSPKPSAKLTDMERVLEFLQRLAKKLGSVAQVAAAVAALLGAVVAALGGLRFGFSS
jgi:hypothetical protein